MARSNNRSQASYSNEKEEEKIKKEPGEGSSIDRRSLLAVAKTQTRGEREREKQEPIETRRPPDGAFHGTEMKNDSALR